MISAHVSQITTVAQRPTDIKRLGARNFWLLFAIEGALLSVALIMMLQVLLPARAPLAQSADYSAVREAIWSRVNGVVNDPLIEIAPQVTARSSSVRGFSLNGQVYYYYFEGQRGYDPLGRGVVTKHDIDVVLRDAGGPKTLIIYRLIQQ